MIKLTTPLTQEAINKLKAGDEVLLSGTIYTVRDRAHQRIAEAIKKKRRLPLALDGAVIYYCGPTKAPKGRPIGACGPTTSGRMDTFTPLLLQMGLKGMIGKGYRSQDVRAAIKRHKAIYFLAHAGCGALLAGYVKKAARHAYADLGPEEILKLEVKDFPLIVGIDAKGNSVYKEESIYDKA